MEKEISVELEQEMEKYLNGKTGIRVLDVSEWFLPCYELSVTFSVSKNRKFNIVEEFIFKCISTGIAELSTVESIKNILKIDDIFIEERIQELLQNGLIDKKDQQLFLTRLGRESYQNGIVPSKARSEELTFFYEPMFQKFRKEQLEIIHAGERFRYYSPEDDSNELQELNLTDTKIMEIGSQLGGIYITDHEESVIGNIQLPVVSNETYVKFGEFWVYDLVEDKVYSCVWDHSEKRFRADISKYLDTKEAEDRLKAVHREMEERNEYYGLIRDSIKKQKNQSKKKNESEISILRGTKIRDAFLSSFAEAKQKIMIICPWISETVVDEAMLQRFKKAVDRNVVIYIGWGIGKQEAHEDRKPPQNLIKKMKNIRDSDGNPAVFVNWIGNHHDKEIIIDYNYHMLGSFNWLSYRGEYKIRSESVYKIKTDKMVSEAVAHTEDIFIEFLEKNINALQTETQYLEWMSEIIHLDTQAERKLALITKVIERLKNKEQYGILYSICKMLMHKQKFEFGFPEIFHPLVYLDCPSNNYKRVLDQLYKQNIEVFEGLINEFADQLKLLYYRRPVERNNKSKTEPSTLNKAENPKSKNTQPPAKPKKPKKQSQQLKQAKPVKNSTPPAKPAKTGKGSTAIGQTKKKNQSNTKKSVKAF